MGILVFGVPILLLFNILQLKKDISLHYISWGCPKKTG